MPNLTPKQKLQLRKLEDLAKKAKESGLNVSIDSPTKIRIDLPKTHDKNNVNKK